MELSLKDLKELFGDTSGNEFPFAKGTNIFIRTVTMAHTGRISAVTDKWIVLEDACWIADTGRFADFLETGKLNECEPFPVGKVVVGLGAIVDCCEWKHKLPREQK